MTRSLDDTLRWTATGSTLLLDEVATVTDWDVATLPGWTRRHLVAHLAANADALGNLVSWAATGVETPMYASPEERAAGIARGAELSGGQLADWLRRSSAALGDAMAALTPAQWETEIRTAQGRLVPATEIPWLRSREVFVHAVDLGAGVGFADLPGEFLAALIEDIAAKRGLDTLPEGPLPEVAAWLAGRPHALAGAPELGPWL